MVSYTAWLSGVTGKVSSVLSTEQDKMVEERRRLEEETRAKGNSIAIKRHNAEKATHRCIWEGVVDDGDAAALEEAVRALAHVCIRDGDVYITD